MSKHFVLGFFPLFQASVPLESASFPRLWSRSKGWVIEVVGAGMRVAAGARGAAEAWCEFGVRAGLELSEVLSAGFFVSCLMELSQQPYCDMRGDEEWGGLCW